MIDLFRPFMSPEVKASIAKVLTPDASGRLYIGQGEQVELFERALQMLLGTDEPPLTMNSCTSAIDLALHLIGVGIGDEVITTPVTCTATNSPIVNRGAIPVWADVDPQTGLIDPADVARKITYNTAAIVAVDWGGALCDYQVLKQLGIPVIQDAAHSLTAGIGGDYVCYSFQAIKHLTTGDGGALITPPEQTERARLLRWYGLDRRSKADFRCEQDITEVGYKYHMNDIAAAIGLANIPHIEHIIAEQRRNTTIYDRSFSRQSVRPSACWLYTLLVDDRPGFISHMADYGIQCSPVHARNDKHTAFYFPNGPLPGVDHFASRNVAIPVGWWLTDAERRAVVSAVNDWRQQHGN